jgi:phosphohistidine phosphatase
MATENPPLGLEGVPTPEQVICSAAVRTHQTADLVVQAMGGAVPLDAYQSLYEADTDLVLQYLRELDEQVRSALVVGHNPTIYRLAWELLGERDDREPGSGHAALDAAGFPTCASAVLVLDIPDWEDLVRGCGRLAGLFRPPY